MARPRPQITNIKGEEQSQISRWEHLAKTAISDYLQTCLTGERREFFSKFAPYSYKWQLHTDRTWYDGHPLDQAVQIARFFEDVAQLPPQILIRTTGYTFTPQNLSQFAIGGPVDNTAQQQRVATINTVTVPMDLAIAALDPDEAHYLVHFIESALGPLCRFFINNLLTPADSDRRNWAVTLPLSWAVSAMTDVPIGEDRKNRLWTQVFSEEVTVEVATWAQYNTPFKVFREERSEDITLTFPVQVKVGSVTPIYTNVRPADSIYRVDDTTLARITAGESLVARRTGNVTLSLISALDRGREPYATADIQIIP